MKIKLNNGRDSVKQDEDKTTRNHTGINKLK